MNKKEIIFSLIIAISLAGLLSLFASSSPDGLEKVASDKGFLEKGDIAPVFSSPIPDYSWPNIKNEKLATSVAGITGTLIVFGLGCIAAVLIRKKHI